VVLLKSIVKEPLLHFLAAAALLFALFYLVNPNPAGDIDDPKRIVVDRTAILKFLQYRTKTFEPKIAAARLDAMSDAQRKMLIDEFIREEVLFREAKAFGLEKGDYIIRRRLVQKLDFISQGVAEVTSPITEEQVGAFFEKNKASYKIAPFITFTHVFFDAKKVKPEAADELAKRKFSELNSRGVAFSEAPKHGDRFPYHVNYVEKSPDLVASHFGVPMAKTLFEIKPNKHHWHGPIRSLYGYHLVMVTKRFDGRIPALAEVKARVTQDLKRKLVRERKDKAVAEIIKTYDIQISPSFREKKAITK
jgi:hypothetical protein